MIRQPHGVEEHGLDVSRFEEGIIGEDFLVRSARREEFQHVHHAQARPADARAPAAFARLDCDAFEEWLGRRLAWLNREARGLARARSISSRETILISLPPLCLRFLGQPHRLTLRYRTAGHERRKTKRAQDRLGLRGIHFATRDRHVEFLLRGLDGNHGMLLPHGVAERTTTLIIRRQGRKNSAPFCLSAGMCPSGTDALDTVHNISKCANGSKYAARSFAQVF